MAGLAGDLLLTNAWGSGQGEGYALEGRVDPLGQCAAAHASLWQIRGAWDHWFIHNARSSESWIHRPHALAGNEGLAARLLLDAGRGDAGSGARSFTDGRRMKCDRIN